MSFIVVSFLIFLLISEIILQLVIRNLRKDFQWLITEQDEYPYFNRKALKKFFNNSFDQELGWVRKPNSKGIERGKYGDIEYHIDNDGSRLNITGGEVTVATFGDSYTFCRQVEDNQTWQVFLSKYINGKVLNYGVGNYGVDQALIYYQRQKLPASTKIVIFGFVPETICRVQSYWKHYLEFGNTFAFKPRFTLENGNLILHKNPIGSISDFDEINLITDSIRNTDEFYLKKFKKFQFRFPYLIKFIVNFKRSGVLLFLLVKKFFFNLLGASNSHIANAPFSKIMTDNVKDAHLMYNDRGACDLLEEILLKFCDEAYKNGHKPLLLVMPQLIDLKIIRELGVIPYQDFFMRLSNKVPTLDITKYVDNADVVDLYSEDVYGGHFSEQGNKLVAEKVSDYLNNTISFK